jgi:uncharacterized protein (TIGR02597 family)
LRKFDFELRLKLPNSTNSSAMNILRLAAGVLLTSVTSLFAQTTATTDPVGFITLNAAGNGGGASPALSFRGLGMTRAIEYQGSAESVGANTLVDNDATWTDNQFNGANGAYFVEITSGPGAGTSYDIQTTAAGTKTITLVQNLGAGIAAPVSFKVRKHWTIATVFGPNNEGGLTGGTAETADQILVQNGANYDPYFYQTSGGDGTGWRKAGAPGVDAGGTVFVPEEGFVLKRNQSAGANIVLMGAVKMGQTSVPIVVGNNLIGNVYAANLTLQSSGLYTGNPATGLVSGDEPSTSDQVLLWNGAGYTTYYYQTAPPAAGGSGWRNATDVFGDASATSIPVGIGLIIKRSNGAAFDWKVPQHPASL